MPFFIDESGREPMELAPGVRTRTFWGENILLSRVEVEPNQIMPLHTHPEEQGGIILEGEFEIGMGGEVQVLKPGDMYIIPGGVEHYAKAGNKGVRALGIYSPVREAFKY